MYKDYLILGGAGLVGLQVCRHIVRRLEPTRIIVASLFEHEAEAAVSRLEAEFGNKVAFVPASGNLFVPSDLAKKSRAELRGSRASSSAPDRALRRLRDRLQAEPPGQDHQAPSAGCHRGLREHGDGPELSGRLRRRDQGPGVDLGQGHRQQERRGRRGAAAQPVGAPDHRHVRFLHRATTEYATKVYLKVGTTGTGGMGLNIPYTHSEDKPSKVLLAKNEAAFGHTGLLFLLARTPNAPIVKEVKPAAMIGYRGVEVRPARDKHGNDDLFEPKAVEVTEAGTLNLSEPVKGYTKQGKLEVPIVDTGENGVFTAGEFVAITAMGQMEYITPEEIAQVVVHEIRGANTGQDIISALDGSVLNPSYKAGLLRNAAMHDLAAAEADSGIPSIALGRLGPPELSKLLFEAHLIKSALGGFDAVLSDTLGPKAMANALADVLESSRVQRTAPSIGIPVLMPDGKTVMRGPRINVPEIKGRSSSVDITKRSDVDKWAKKGWIDLRPANMKRWKERFTAMVEARRDLRAAGSAAATIQTYMGATMEIGEVVAWIFNNELGGHRIK